MQQATFANIIGPDINEFRGDVNYALLATKTNYCYVRGSSSGTGRFRVDRKFFEYVKGLRSVGILSGAYHYAVPSTDLTTADAQCDDFIRVLQEAYGPGNYGDLFPVVDIETPQDKSISTDNLLDWVDRFRKRFERRTRRRLMLYTGLFFIQLYNNFRHSTKGYILSNMPLWIAMYKEIPSNPPFPPDVGGWTRWRMWQYSESGTMAGINPPVDLNYGPTNLDFLKPPEVVKNFKAFPGKSSISLTWSKNPDVDLNGYNIFINSNYVTTVSKNTTSYTIKLAKAPRPNERYEITIEAFDVDGDFSPTRAKAQVTFRNSDINYDDMEDVMIKNNSPENYVLEDTFLPKLSKKKNYQDPVDYLQREYINNQSDRAEYFGEEDDFDFYNLPLEEVDVYNPIGYNYGSPTGNINEVNPEVRYREIDSNLSELNIKPVFKYNLNEEEEEFEDFDNFDNFDNFEDDDEFNSVPVFSDNSFEFDEDDFDVNYEEQAYYREEDYSEDEDRLDIDDYDMFNNQNLAQYNTMINPKYNKYIKENISGNERKPWEVEDFREEDNIVVQPKEVLETPKVSTVDQEEEEEEIKDEENSIVYNNEYEDSIRYRRVAENQLEFRNKKCKKCKKYKKSKKYCYDCKHYEGKYEVGGYEHHEHHHDDNYLYHPNYHLNDNYKNKKKKKHHREY